VHHLQLRGVSRRVLGLFRPVDTDRACSQFVITRYDDNGDEEKRPVAVKKQAAWLERCYQEPYHMPYILYLSDFKNGEVARAAAAAIFSQACHQYRVSDRERPLWVRLSQDYNQPLPLSGNERPAFVVLDNVFTDSTSAKVEKLRDVLAFYDDTPIVVICATPGSPWALVERYNVAGSYGVLLRDTRVLMKEDEV
jgi:hypothetical protein